MIHYGKHLDEICARSRGLLEPMNEVGNASDDGIIVGLNRGERVAKSQRARGHRPRTPNIKLPVRPLRKV